MEPSFLSGDVIVAKKTNIFSSFPLAGECAIFIQPKTENEIYLKRVIGVPGDKVEIIKDEVYINDQKLERQLVTDPYADDGHQYYREINRGKGYIVRYNPNHFFRVDLPAKILGSGEYFVMGDNRDYSYDSRFWGSVKQDRIIAKPWFIWFSYLYNQKSEQHIFRSSRLFKFVD